MVLVLDILFVQRIAINKVIKIKIALTEPVLRNNGDQIKDINDKPKVEPISKCLSATRNTATNPHKARKPNKQHKIQSRKRTGLLLILFIIKITRLMINILILKATCLYVVTNKIFI